MLQVIAEKMKKGVQRYLIVRNEFANKHYTTEFVQQLFSEEGKGEVRVHQNIFHTMSGTLPTFKNAHLQTLIRISKSGV